MEEARAWYIAAEAGRAFLDGTNSSEEDAQGKDASPRAFKNTRPEPREMSFP